MPSKRSMRIVCAVALAASMLAASSASAYINVFGGPTYTPGVGGFKDGWVTGVNDAGTAIGNALKYDATDTERGVRAVRWDALGTAELGNLGTDMDGFANSYANAINDAGTVVGNVDIYDGSGQTLGYRAVRWEASGTAATELGNLGTDTDGFTYSDVFAINKAGTAVGIANKYDGSGEWVGDRAVRWDALGTVAIELGNLGTDSSGYTESVPLAINDAGTVVGDVEKFGGSGESLGVRAVRWDASGTVATELGNLGTDIDGYAESIAYAINDAGTAVGWADMYDSEGTYQGYRAVRWDASGTVATELGNLGTDVDGAAISFTDAINDTGTIVGYAEKYDGAGVYLGGRAVRWNASGTSVTELGNLGTDPDGVTDSEAYAINDAGIAVGYAADYDGSGTLFGDRAVYWSLDGLAVDLNMLIDSLSGWTLEYADAISDTGWIAGSGTFDPDGPGGQEAYERLFLMQVPALSVLPGDYNHDGAVNAADYVMWRKRRATSAAI